MKFLLVSTLASTVMSAALPTNVYLESRSAPNIPSTSTAKSLLAGLTVAPQGPQTGYSRDLFPHWITISGYVTPFTPLTKVSQFSHRNQIL